MPPPPVCDVYMHWEPSSAPPPPRAWQDAQLSEAGLAR